MCGGMFGLPVTAVVIVMIALAGLVGWLKDENDETGGGSADADKSV